MPLALPLITIWWLLRGGLTVLTVEPDAPDLTEPPVDVYGTPWGEALGNDDSGALQISGTPTIVIPDGIPTVA